MNKQFKIIDGRKIHTGIEWTDYSWNPIGGCLHGCRWQMPDGTIAECYAETTAEGIAYNAYPKGFEHHYWNPRRLDEPLGQRQPSKIFLDSMSDIMGSWVPDEQITQVLEVCEKAHWHDFQLLTKNAPRMARFRYPPNVWVGVSSPPDFFMGKRLSRNQQARMLMRSLDILREVDARIVWMSIEPLSWDISPFLYDHPLDWAVIGAASRGREYFQPNPMHVEKVLAIFDRTNMPVFFKGNLDWKPWREEFPK